MKQYDLTVQVTRKDLFNYNKIQSSRSNSLLNNIVKWLLLFLIFLLIFQVYEPEKRDVIAFLAGAALIILGIVSSIKLSPNKDSLMFQPSKIHINENEIKQVTPYSTASISWAMVQKLENYNGTIMIFFDPHIAFLIPFDSVEDHEAFFKQLKTWFEASRTTSNKEC